MQAAEKVVEMGGEVAVAMEALVEALWLPCLTRHRRLGHVKTSSAISSPSALETRARMETCSEPQRTRGTKLHLRSPAKIGEDNH